MAHPGPWRRLTAPLAAPRWLAAVLGVAATGIGVGITAKPFRSLDVLIVLVTAGCVVAGVAEVAGARSWPVRAAGAAWIAAGIVVAVWPGLSLRGLAVVVGIGLVAGGALRLAAALRRGADDRLVAVLGGLTRAVFGVLALAWPDLTLLVVALLVGPALIVFGFAQVVGAVWRHEGAEGAGRRRPRRGLRVSGAALGLVSALVLLLVSGLVHRSSAEGDAFYVPPADVPATPGALLRTDRFTRAVPAGAEAWRILYTTTRDDRTPAVASAIVLAARDRPAGPRPVVAWAHGTTGFASRCAPSILGDPFTAGAMPSLDQVVSNGWVMVATDYVGLGADPPHPYLIGEPEARSVLDAVRAARSMDQVELARRTVVWGHSQGGGAALWAGIVAPRYAPDADVVAVAALAPATELPAIFSAVKDSPVGRIMGSYVVSAYAARYPDVGFDDYIRAAARVQARETAERCLSGPEALVSVGTALAGESWFARNPADGPLGARLRENIPRGRIPATLMIAQGLADALVLPAAQRRYVGGLCRAGQALEYRTYRGLDHVGLVLAPGSPLREDLVTWTQDRLAGRPGPTGCRVVAR